MAKSDVILKEYTENLEKYRRLEKIVKDKLDTIMKEERIMVLSCDHRVKEKQSLRGKLLKKGDKYQSLQDITDILGFRLICYFSGDVDRMARAVEKCFVIDWENSIDKRRMLDPRTFGYLSLHYICSLPAGEEYPEDLTGIRFEIQMRSSLQHVWAEIEHDLGYKGEYGVPREIRRQFSRLAGLLEIADAGFDKIREDMKEYDREVKRKIANDEELDLEIDMISLRQYMSKSYKMTAFYEQITEEVGLEIIPVDPQVYVRQLEYLGITTLDHLHQMLQTDKELAIALMKDSFAGSDLEFIASNAVLLFLCRADMVRRQFPLEQICGFVALTKHDPLQIRESAERIFAQGVRVLSSMPV